METKWTTDEVIDQIDDCIAHIRMNQAVKSVMLNARDLLKEQEAKQIVRKQCKKEHEDGSIDYFAEWYCPHCNMLILRGFDNPSIKFCYKCGKPILWESGEVG